MAGRNWRPAPLAGWLPSFKMGFVQRLQTFRQQTLDHEIAWLKGTTPYRVFGEWATWLLAAMGAVATFVSVDKIWHLVGRSPT